MRSNKSIVKEKLSGSVDTLSKRDGVYTARREFFYRHGMTSQAFAEGIKSRLPQAEIISAHEHWAPFRGGASVASSSHWEAKFIINTKEELEDSKNELEKSLPEYKEKLGDAQRRCDSLSQTVTYTTPSYIRAEKNRVCNKKYEYKQKVEDLDALYNLIISKLNTM